MSAADQPLAVYPTTLALAKIRPGKNPRRYFDSAKHDELVVSFRLRGMLQPMLLRPMADDVFEIVAGERRYKAALEAFGPEGEAPVTIRVMTDQEALEAAIDENDCRDDASETEQADAAVRALAASQGDRVEAAKRLGWSASKLDRRLALANLSDTVKTALDERRIKVGHAELLAVVPADKQNRALETILTAGLDVGKTRDLLMRVTQNLGAANFDKTECTTCPFNSAAQRALFETHVEDGHCTNPGCFQLKTEAVEQKNKTEIEAGSGAKVAHSTKESGALQQESAPVASSADRGPRAGSSPAPAKPIPASSPPAAKKVTVTADAIGIRMMDVREKIWMRVLNRGAEADQEFARAFEAVLRAHWRVDADFLGRFSKDELKFIAQECGLIAHMGERKFAKLLESTVPSIVAGMLNATGFNWAGRLPSAITLDGEYGPPPEAAIADTTTASEKD